MQDSSDNDAPKEVVIRVLVKDGNGKIQDWQQEFDVSDFGGCVPSIGDTILYPGVLQGRDRRKPENRDVWKVVDRVFNPMDLANYVALVVEERKGSPADAWI